MILEFKYNLPIEIVELMYTNIEHFNGNNKITGYIDEGDFVNLSKTSLFLVAKIGNDPNRITYSNPVVIVGRNESDALSLYSDKFKEYGAIVAKILDNCNNMPIEID